MQPPIRGKVTLGVDPGFRTGCKLAVVDETGRVLETGVGYFTLPNHEAQKPRAKAQILGMIRRHKVTAVAIGNGTASRESEQFIASLLPEAPGVAYVIVSEAGASVYSASKLAAKEFPEYDVSLSSAVSIARRMQDPLAELVKIDPKAIGVGQYQHDLQTGRAGRTRSPAWWKAASTSVGVDVETASASLLDACGGHRRSAGQQHCGLSGRKTALQLARPAQKGAEAGRRRRLNSARASCACRRQQSAGRDGGSSRKLCGGKSAAGEAGLCAAGLENAAASSAFWQRPNRRAWRSCANELGVGEPTLRDIASELEKPGARSARRTARARAAHGCAQHGGFEARHGTDGHGAQRHRFRRVCGYRRASGRPGAYLPDGGQIHPSSERGGAWSATW